MIVAAPGLTRKVDAGLARSQAKGLTEVVLVCACDNHYAMPLNVMLHSAVRSLGEGHRLTVYFLDGGLEEDSWCGLRETLAGLPIDVWAIRPDYSLVEHLHTSHHVTPAAYLRLLTAELTPEHIERAIYLDSDVLVREDLSHLWRMPLKDNYCLAAPDIACPWIDARAGCANWRNAGPYLAAVTPVPNYREFGLDPAGEYFNSGVMLLNLRRWREDQVAVRMLDLLDKHRRHVWCWDQYALNIVFHGQWGRLSPRWNQGAHVLEYPSIANSPIDRGEFAEMMRNPAIVHFTTEFKPWHYHSTHLRGDEFFAALDETSYRHWRPEKPEFTWEMWNRHMGIRLVKWWITNYRKVSTIWTPPRKPR